MFLKVGLLMNNYLINRILNIKDEGITYLLLRLDSKSLGLHYLTKMSTDSFSQRSKFQNMTKELLLKGGLVHIFLIHHPLHIGATPGEDHICSLFKKIILLIHHWKHSEIFQQKQQMKRRRITCQIINI